ncbi:DUF4231 domain-containing protein [Stenotrophomonas maltophilia]|uniref:DUF4231 domain-containing protein n=1 Tax=Stenotrophomonas maltophilia TaxID=40324 RepID=UPI0009B2BAC4|nr:DUF4231 domain-containing protein [Stenotrophomonas maltophilia]
MKEGDFPSIYRAADRAAAEAQRNFFAALGLNYFFLIAAAALSVANVKSQSFAVLQIIPLLVTLSITIYLGSKQPQRAWYGARALAESIKTVAWRFMMRAAPFDGDLARAELRFKDHLSGIISSNKRISEASLDCHGGDQLTAGMQSVRAMDIDGRLSIYESNRIGDQHAWYVAKAALNKKLSRRWFAVLIAVNSLALLFALGKVLNPVGEYWPADILVAMAGAAMAWTQSKRFQELSAAYSLTSHEIGLLRIGLRGIKSEKGFSKFVSDAENAFSREHTQWQARMDSE